MQQIENSTQNKKASKFENLFIYYPIWLGIVYIFQTFQIGISDATYQQLRQILEKQNGRAYSFEETKEIGYGLVEFFTILMVIEG